MAARGRGEEAAKGIDVWQLLGILRRRLVWLVFPFVLVLASGFAVVMKLPPVFLAEGKLLVQSQRIPIDLVRPTIATTAKERIEVIQQRVMTRENLLAVADKFQLGGDQKSRVGTQVVDLIRTRTQITPFELDSSRQQQGSIALKIGFEYEQPETAMKVANELITLILAEDARNRARQAQETTSFLAKDLKKRQDALNVLDQQIAEFRRSHDGIAADPKSAVQLTALKAELEEKASLYSSKHPEMVRIRRQIAAIEKMTSQAADYQSGLEALQNQREGIEKSIEDAAQKEQAARLGESLEHAGVGASVEVLEQAITPQRPIKPNRPKLLALVFAAAVGAGLAAVVGREMLVSGIRSARDLERVAGSHLLVQIPYIATKKEIRDRKVRTTIAAGSFAGAAVVGLVFVHLLVRPLDDLWHAVMARVMLG